MIVSIGPYQNLVYEERTTSLCKDPPPPPLRKNRTRVPFSDFYWGEGGYLSTGYEQPPLVSGYCSISPIK